MIVPQIAITADGPAIAHSSDFSLVTASKPAAPGEILSLFAMTGDPSASNPPAPVNSPVRVLVNGTPADIPTQSTAIQVNFRIPPDTAKGLATVQLSAAWTTGTAVSITVQ